MEATYLISAQKASQLPEFAEAEIAFMGRSNCGKSSLLNALANHKTLARSSSTPGRTQMANFFRLATAESSLVLADLPGYGFNVAGKATRKLWSGLLEAYIERENIREFLFLVDCRRGLDDFEVDFISRLGKKRPVCLVLTKGDKLSAAQAKAKKNDFKKALEGVDVGVVLVSSLKKKGIAELRNRLLEHGKKAESLS